MSTFEKFAFPDLGADKENYYTPAPQDDDLNSDDTTLEDSLDYLDDELDYLDDDIESTPPEDDGLPKPVLQEDTLLLNVRNLNKIYKQGEKSLHVLNNVNIRLNTGEITALVGPSGSGKSTLLHILGLLDSPTTGQILMQDQDISKITDRTRTKLRNDFVGFVYQFHHLLPEFSALENVALPQIIAGIDKKDAEEKAADLLGRLKLSHRINHRPATLSGGEQQRVAIARALVNDPIMIFADEPTGNLDPETAEEVFQLLLEVVRSRGVSALIATHNLDLAHEMDRVLEVKSGRVLPY